MHSFYTWFFLETKRKKIRVRLDLRLLKCGFHLAIQKKKSPLKTCRKLELFRGGELKFILNTINKNTENIAKKSSLTVWHP